MNFLGKILTHAAFCKRVDRGHKFIGEKLRPRHHKRKIANAKYAYIMSFQIVINMISFIIYA